MAKTAPEQIADLTAKLTKATTVEKGAQTLIETFPKLLNDAVAAAVANGATAEQLQPVSDLADTMDQESDALNAAVLAGTPSAP